MEIKGSLVQMHAVDMINDERKLTVKENKVENEATTRFPRNVSARNWRNSGKMRLIPSQKFMIPAA